MPVFIDGKGKGWNHPDGTPDFNTWLAANPARTEAWLKAGDAYKAHLEANNGQPPVDGEPGKIFMQWAREVLADRVPD